MEIRDISAAAALRVSAVVLLVIVAFRFLWLAHAIFIVTFLGVLLGLAVERAADSLEKIHIKRAIGSPLVLLVGVGLLVALFAAIGPSLRQQTRQLSTDLPKAMRQVEHWINRTPAKNLLAPHLPPPPQPPQPSQQPSPQPSQQPRQEQPQESQQPQPQEQRDGLTAQIGRELRGATRFLFPIVSTVVGAVGGLVLILFIAMYIGATPGLYREGILHLVPHRNRARAGELLDTLRVTLRQWLIARLLAMVIIGVLTGLGLMAIGIEGAAALGVLAGLLEFVPYFGPIASAIPAIGIALVDSPQKALWVIGLYTLMQQLEGNIVTPLLLKKRLDIPPVLTVVVVSSLGVVFGVIGMLIAEPLLATVLVTMKMLYVQDVVGDEVTVAGKPSA